MQRLIRNQSPYSLALQDTAANQVILQRQIRKGAPFTVYIHETLKYTSYPW